MGKICANCSTDNPANFKYCSSCGHELPKSETENISQTQLPPPPPKKKNKCGLILFIIGVIVYYSAAGFVVQKLASPFLYTKTMEASASKINSSCPVMIDDETRLDNVTVLPGNAFQYNYTLINVDKGKIDTTKVITLLEPKMVESIKSNPDMQMQRDHRTTLNYCYRDKNGDYLFMISVTPDKYE